MLMSVDHQTMNKRTSPFFVKDILGLSDESESESEHAMDSGDDQTRESSMEDSLESRKLNFIFKIRYQFFVKSKVNSPASVISLNNCLGFKIHEI